jgi:hypothetical protein
MGGSAHRAPGCGGGEKRGVALESICFVALLYACLSPCEPSPGPQPPPSVPFHLAPLAVAWTCLHCLESPLDPSTGVLADRTALVVV